MDTKNSPYEWVGTLPRLEEIAQILSRTSIIGVDLEADSMYHYFEKVCLIQVSTELTSYVIEPLSLGNLAPLNPIFSNPRIRKVFHGADYDIRSLYRDFQIRVENLFDTQLACKFLGFKETGLEAMLRSRFHIDMNKNFQRADWSQRPLPVEMIEYAVMDGLFLIPLARMLEKELQDLNRLSWVEEECRLLSKVRFTGSRPDPLCLKVKGASRLDPRSLAILESLLQFRKTQAQKVDLPPFKVIRNESILELVRQKPICPEDLEAGNILSRKQIQRYGKPLLEEIQRAMAIPPENLWLLAHVPRPVLPSPVRRRVQALKTWRDAQAKHLRMDPGDFLNNALINDLAWKNPRSAQQIEEIPGLRKWLQDIFSEEILAVLQKGE